MNRVNLADEYICLVDSNFSLEWFAPEVERLCDLILEKNYTNLQFLILECALRLYSITRELSKTKTESLKTKNAMRRLANAILNYAISCGGSTERQRARNFFTGWSKLLELTVESSQSPNPSRIPATTSSIEDSPLGIHLESALSSIRDRVANIDSLVIPQSGSSLEAVQKLKSTLQTLIDIRLNELEELSAENNEEGNNQSNFTRPIEFIKAPKLLLERKYSLYSFPGDAIDGEYLSSWVLHPGETLEISVEKQTREELTQEVASCVVDSNSTEAQTELQNSLQETDTIGTNTNTESSEYLNIRNHLDAYANASANVYSIDAKTGINWSTDIESGTQFNNSVDTTVSAEKIKNAVSNQVSKANTARSLTVSEKSEKTITTHEKYLKVQKIQSLSECRATRIALYQIYQKYDIYITLWQLNLIATNGFEILRAPIQNYSEFRTALTIFAQLEKQLMNFKIKNYTGADISPIQGLKNTDEATGKKISYGIPLVYENMTLKTDRTRQNIELLSPRLLDEYEMLRIHGKSKIFLDQSTKAEVINDFIRKINSANLDNSSLVQLAWAILNQSEMGIKMQLMKFVETDKKLFGPWNMQGQTN